MKNPCFNLIEDEAASRLEKYYQGWLDQQAEGNARYEALLSLGFLSWRDGNETKARMHFHQSAQLAVELLDAYEDRGATREIAHFLTPLMLILAFGDRDACMRLSNIPQQSWFYPVDIQFVPLANLIETVNRAVLGELIPQEKIEAGLRENQSPDANSFYRPYIAASYNILMSLQSHNIAGLQQGMEILLHLHEQEAFEGAWKKRVEGMVSLWASALQRVIAGANVKISISSIYLPQ